MFKNNGVQTSKCSRHQLDSAGFPGRTWYVNINYLVPPHGIGHREAIAFFSCNHEKTQWEGNRKPLSSQFDLVQPHPLLLLFRQLKQNHEVMRTNTATKLFMYCLLWGKCLTWLNLLVNLTFTKPLWMWGKEVAMTVFAGETKISRYPLTHLRLSNR